MRTFLRLKFWLWAVVGWWFAPNLFVLIFGGSPGGW